MASGKQQVATGVEIVEKEINSLSKGHINPKVNRFLQSLKSAIIQDNLQEMNTHATALKDALQKENIRLSDNGNKWLNQVQNRVHTQSKQPPSEMIVHGKEVDNRGQVYGTEGPRSAERAGASGEGPRSRPQSNEDKAQRTQGTGNDKLEISVQPVTEQQQNAVGEQGKKPSTTDQSGGNAGQIRIIDGRSGKKNTVFKPDDKSKSGGKIEQKPFSSVIDVTNINVELDASKHSHTLSTALHESDEKDVTQSSAADKSLYGDKQDHDSNDSENLQEQLINMKDKLDARQKELKDSHQQLNKEIEEKNQIKIKNSELEERDDRYQQQLKDYRVIKEELTAKLKQVLKQKEEDEENMNLNYEKLLQDLQEQRTKLQEEKQKNKQKTENFESQIRDLKDRNNKLTAENQDLSRRYSQVASAQLKDNNPDIVDLSDPNRAMKLGEKYGQLYNDTWTDAFEAQQTLEVSDKEGIRILLNVLKNSYDFCEQRAQKQLDGVSSLLLYPCKDQEQHLSKGKGVLDKPRIPSSNKKALLDIRRQVATVEGVKQAFLSHMHNIMETEKERSVMEASKEYYVKCVEICWLMVLHDPPLCMVMDVEPGAKVDPNLYSVLSKGDKVDYLVWPPLLNGRGGGLLQKGVVEVIKAGKKKVPKAK